MSFRITTRRFAIISGMVIVVAFIAALAYQVYANREFDRAWRSDLAGLGARVVSSRVTTSIPFVDIRLSQSNNIDVYVSKAATADAVVELAMQNPELNRVFLSMSAFDHAAADGLGKRIQELRPDVQIVLVNTNMTVERWVGPVADE